jgi:subtilase family serine protease
LRKLCSVLSVHLLLILTVSTPLQSSEAQALLKDPITQPIESSSMTKLAGSMVPRARTEFDTGLTDNAKVLQGMTINFKRSEAQDASLQALLAAQQDPSSSSYHKWLTAAQFGQQFGMSAADLVQVSAWVQQEGFTVSSVAQSSNSISFSGSVASVERAFQTQTHNYSVNGESHYANATTISIPGALGGLVNSVHGLDNFRLKRRVMKGKFTSGILEIITLHPGILLSFMTSTPSTARDTPGKG